MPIAESALQKGTILHGVKFRANPKKSDTPVVSNICDEGVTTKIMKPVLKGLKMVPAPDERWDCEVLKITGNKKGKKRNSRFGTIYLKPVKRILDLHLPGVYVDKKQLRAMLLVVQDPNRNLMIVGPQGAGKSVLSRAIADQLTAKYFKVSGGLIKKSDRMLGSVNAGTNKDKLTFVFEYSPFTAALKYAQDNPHERVVVHVDEWTRIDEDARDGVLDVLEGAKRELHLPNGEVITVDKNVFFIASGNVGSQFVLRRKDAANNDRWEIFYVDYMPHDVERGHCQSKYPKVPTDQMDIALKVINHLRNCYKKGKHQLPYAPSSRRSEAIAMYLASDDFTSGEFTMEDILGWAIVNQYDGPVHSDSTDMARVTKVINEALAKIANGDALDDDSNTPTS